MNALLRYPGAKWQSASKIINYIPNHKSYLEPFFGSGAILFNKNKSNIETINDIDNEVINFFETLKNNYEELKDRLNYIPYSRTIFDDIKNRQPKNNIERAVKFFVISLMSHSGYRPRQTGWSHVKNPNGSNKAIALKKVVDSLERFTNRLKEVYIENYNALDLIAAHDFKDTFIYLDPPYSLETRIQSLYKHEFNKYQQEVFLDVVLNVKNAKVLLSGYDNKLYNEKLREWNKEVFDSFDNNGKKKQEVLWFNYEVPKQLTLF